jgi:two-component system CheB/CheR fusion protein
VLSRDAEAQKLPQVRKAVEAIRRNALTQARLVSDLLDLSRLQTGKLALHRQPIQLVPLLTDAVEAVRDETDLKRIELQVEMTQEPLLVEADPVRVQQIVWNLLHNAVKFTPQGGRVTFGLEREGDQARLQVADTGQGVDPALLPGLFEMFRQADGRTGGRRQGGMGIGLALVRQLAELHGGRVAAESEGPGRGARFTVWLPLL